MKKSDEHSCIDAKHVPCPKARAYLAKHGKLCGSEPAKPRTKKVKSFLEEWFG